MIICINCIKVIVYLGFSEKVKEIEGGLRLCYDSWLRPLERSDLKPGKISRSRSSINES
jgi:hypothetical protein